MLLCAELCWVDAVTMAAQITWTNTKRIHILAMVAIVLAVQPCSSDANSMYADTTVGREHKRKMFQLFFYSDNFLYIWKFVGTLWDTRLPRKQNRMRIDKNVARRKIDFA